MAQARGNGVRRKIAGTLASVVAALLFAAVPFQLAVANPARGGGGGAGFHGGGRGFHASGGVFRGGGFRAGGFHGGAFHSGEFHRGGFRRGFPGGVAVGVGGIYAPYLWYYGYPYYDYYGYSPDYGDYGYPQPDAGQVWYYCSDPAGYYPDVTQCNTGWRTVPAG